MRRKTRLDVLGGWRRSTLVVDEPRAARSQNVDPVRPRAKFERSTVFDRNRNGALPLDPGLRDGAARFALEGEKEVEPFLNVRPVEGESRIVAEQPKAGSGSGQKLVARLGREGAGRIGFDKLLKRGVPRNSCFAWPNVALDRVEHLQSENVFGIDRVRIAAQSLDSGDAERFWAQLDRRAWRRSPLRLEIGWPIECAREAEIKLAALFRLLHRSGASSSPHALQKARGDRRLAAALLRPAQNGLARAEGADEIMRRLANAALRRRKAKRGAHRAIEKGVGLDRGWPDGFVQAGQKHAIKAQETRFEQAEDRKAWVSAACRWRARASRRVVEQSRVFVERSREIPNRRLAPFVHELRQLLKTVRHLHPAVRSHKCGGDRGPMLRQAIAQGSGGAKGAQGRERIRDVTRKRFRGMPVRLADAADGGMRVPVVGRCAGRREGPFEIIERRKRDRTKDRELERPRRGFNLLKRAAEAGRGMRKEREKGARRELDRGFKDQPGQYARRTLS